jgi:hypothetical protein
LAFDSPDFFMFSQPSIESSDKYRASTLVQTIRR